MKNKKSRQRMKTICTWNNRTIGLENSLMCELAAVQVSQKGVHFLCSKAPQSLPELLVYCDSRKLHNLTSHQVWWPFVGNNSHLKGQKWGNVVLIPQNIILNCGNKLAVRYNLMDWFFVLPFNYHSPFCFHPLSFFPSFECPHSNVSLFSDTW